MFVWILCFVNYFSVCFLDNVLTPVPVSVNTSQKNQKMQTIRTVCQMHPSFDCAAFPFFFPAEQHVCCCGEPRGFTWQQQSGLTRAATDSGNCLLFLQVESNQFGLDDTSLNGIRLVCAKDEDRSFLYTIESHTG